jgi:hypothetical protein
VKIRLCRPYIKRTPLGYPTRAEDCCRTLWHRCGFGGMWFLDWYDGLLELRRVRIRDYESHCWPLWKKVWRWI